MARSSTEVAAPSLAPATAVVFGRERVMALVGPDAVIMLATSPSIQIEVVIGSGFRRDCRANGHTERTKFLRYKDFVRGAY